MYITSLFITIRYQLFSLFCLSLLLPPWALVQLNSLQLAFLPLVLFLLLPLFTRRSFVFLGKNSLKSCPSSCPRRSSPLPTLLPSAFLPSQSPSGIRRASRRRRRGLGIRAAFVPDFRRRFCRDLPDEEIRRIRGPHGRIRGQEEDGQPDQSQWTEAGAGDVEMLGAGDKIG